MRHAGIHSWEKYDIYCENFIDKKKSIFIFINKKTLSINTENTWIELNQKCAYSAFHVWCERFGKVKKTQFWDSMTYSAK